MTIDAKLLRELADRYADDHDAYTVAGEAGALARGVLALLAEREAAGAALLAAEESAQLVEDLIDNPPPPTPKLIALMKGAAPFVVQLPADLAAARAALAALTAARDAACDGWERRLCFVETVPGPPHPDRHVIAALRDVKP